MIQELKARLKELETHADRIKVDGAIAPANVWIDCYPAGKDSVIYARARSDQAIFNGGKKLMALGRMGSDRYKEYKLRIQRRDALAEIERRANLIHSLIYAELTDHIWEPEPEAKEPDSKTVSKSRARS